MPACRPTRSPARTLLALAAASVAFAAPAQPAAAAAKTPACAGAYGSGAKLFFTTVNSENAIRVRVSTCAHREGARIVGTSTASWAPLPGADGRPKKRFSSFSLAFPARRSNATLATGGCQPGKTTLLARINADVSGRFTCKFDLTLPDSQTVDFATSISYGFLGKTAKGPYRHELSKVTL